MRPTTAARPSDDDEVTQLRTRVRDLELALGQRDDSLSATFRLTPVLNNLMGLLLSVPAVTPEMIRQRLEIAPDAKVAMHRLRKHMKDWDIEIHSRRNVGYWLEDEDKTRIRGLIAQKMRGQVTPQVIAEIDADDDMFDGDEEIAAS
jgi:hypothetical protein